LRDLRDYFYFLKADVLKQLAIYTIKADFLRSKLKDQQAMKKRLKEFAGTLLYSLESIQKYYSQNLRKS
jgi:hypothetical protein